MPGVRKRRQADPPADVRNRALYGALRLAGWLLPSVPQRVAYALASIAGSIAYFLSGSAREGILANLEVAFPEEPTGKRRRIARAAFRHNARNWIDTLRIPRVSGQELLRQVDVHGWELVTGAIAEGKGAIVTSMHLGNFDLVGQVFAARGLALTVPVERVEPPELFELLTRQRESKGIRTFPLDRAPRALLSALRHGEAVAVTADRYIAGKGILVDLFGRPALLPAGPASLSRHTGAPIIFGIGIRQSSNRFEALITHKITPMDSGNPEQDEQALTQAIARLMEDRIRQYPEQWLAFAPIWSGTSNPAPATIERQKEAAV